MMSVLLLGIPGVVVFIDDIIITAQNAEVHLERLREVLKRLNDSGLRIKFEKCQFLQDEVTYLGYRVDKHGVHPMEDKIESVRRAPRPENRVRT